MNKIDIGILDEHKIVQEGICALLKDVNDIEVVLTASTSTGLNEKLRSVPVHILIINLHSYNTKQINMIMQLNIVNPKIRILIISVHNEEEIIHKAIKAGVKGILSKETDKDELVKAIYTLRNGYDYFSNSITHLLLNKYIMKLKTEDQAANLDQLSSREIEILSLWGKSFSNKDISDKLFISVRTVESHKNHIMQKLNIKTTVDLVKFGIKNNIIEF